MKFNTEENTSRISGWIKYYKGFSHGLYLSNAGYFDERPEIYTSVTQVLTLIMLPILATLSLWFLVLIPFLFFGYGKLFIYLPIKTGIEDCDSARWGISFHDDSIWVYIGGGVNFEGGTKFKSFNMPWAWEWYRTSIMLKNDTWEHEYKKSSKNFYEEKWDKLRYTTYATYKDPYDDKIISATVTVSEREWRRKSLYKIPIFNKLKRVIDVSFDEEVGPEKNSYKGGIIGKSYNLLKDESIVDCLQRNGFDCVALNRDRMITDLLDSK